MCIFFELVNSLAWYSVPAESPLGFAVGRRGTLLCQIDPVITGYSTKVDFVGIGLSDFNSHRLKI